MNCFPCFDSNKSDTERNSEEEQLPVAQPKEVAAPLLPSHCTENTNPVDPGKIAAKAFTFREMAIATKNFRQECLLFDDGFGKVYKGTLKPSGEVVAIRQLDRNGMKGSKEFLEEVAALSPLKHPNLISLIGYCADGDQRILVYEYMPFGSLEAHLLARPEDESPIDWTTRMKIATGAAQGLQYLHDEANPPVIYRDFKSSNILLDEEFNPRLCDFGLAKVAESGSTSTVPPRAMGTYGYSAPEYSSSGELTMKSDVYSFGVVLLELISGRRAVDPNRPPNEQNLITWAKPIFRDPRRFCEMADPLLMLDFSVKSLNQAIGVAAMCLQEEPSVRPYITDVVTALSFLDFNANDPPAAMPSGGNESTKDIADDGDKSDIGSERSSSNQKDDDDDADTDDDDDVDADDNGSSSSHDEDDEEIVNDDNDDDNSSNSSHDEDDEEIVNNDNDDDNRSSSSHDEDDEEIVNNDNDDDNSSNASHDEDDKENVNNDNDDNKCRSSLDHEDNDNKELCGNKEENENISESHDDHWAGISNENEDDNNDEINDDMSCYSMDDDDTALIIELDDRNSSSDMLLDEDSGEEEYDDDEIKQIMRRKSSNSKKGKVMEISDDESIYSPTSSRSSSSSIDNNKLGEKKTTQKAKSTKKSSVGNLSTKKSKNRWRRAKQVLNHETEN